MKSGSQLRPPAPPAVGTAGFREQAWAVVGAQQQLTPEQKNAAKFWEGGQGTALPPAAKVLAHTFPDRAKLWQERGRKAGLSRIWGGTHYPVDDISGARMGRRIGELAVARLGREGGER